MYQLNHRLIPCMIHPIICDLADISFTELKPVTVNYIPVLNIGIVVVRCHCVYQTINSSVKQNCKTVKIQNCKSSTDCITI